MQIAFFDFDHTVTTCDTYSRFLRRVATPEQLAAAKWKVAPWLLGYRTGVVSARDIRARVTRLTFAGRDVAEIAAHGEPYARDLLPAMLRPEMMKRIEWHQPQGHDVALISGSLDLYLRPWCERHGLSLICNRLESSGDRLTGRYLERDIGPHKAQEIRARYDLSRYERIHAYGDSREDKPMLARAHERWYAGKRIR
ncbi:HAD family hydrolase [Vulcaniibacterium tengchongense]|uniref:HAD superfamily hydrolase (TIGR01490 family) n=1 Tax=Vulcaniibacterium tengchongense TaxID=1273429 RepID=A0A3N4VFC1_9GAMM|nr:HAD family hydrolase [Vulcaniibacterium tengchongense]RPE81368.1 HAD superfamily hydrolase (TIGR01490 family) [Vulcaniibacterium tengchongense]